MLVPLLETPSVPVTPLEMSPEIKLPVVLPSSPTSFVWLLIGMLTGPVMKILVSVGLRVAVPPEPPVRLMPAKDTEGVPLVTLAPLVRLKKLLPQMSVPRVCWKAAPGVARLSVRVLAKVVLPLRW